MPFAFNQVDPETSGQADQMDVPLSRYLGAQAAEGVHDSVFGMLYRHQELSLEAADPDGQTIQPDEANRRFGSESLTFDQPVKVGVAQMLQQRKQAETDRQFFLQQGDTDGWRHVAGMGVSMTSSMMNPLDLGLMFLPIVGEGAKLADGASVLGRGLNRGLISAETMKEVAPLMPKLATSVVQGMGYAAMAEVPKLMTYREEHDLEPSPIQDILSTGAFAGGMHLGIGALAKLFGKLGLDTQMAMHQKAMDDFAKGNDIKVEHIAKLDPAVAQEQVHTFSYGNESGIQQYLQEHYPKGPSLVRDGPSGFGAEFAHTMEEVQAGQKPPEPPPSLAISRGIPSGMTKTMEDIQGGPLGEGEKPLQTNPNPERGISNRNDPIAQQYQDYITELEHQQHLENVRDVMYDQKKVDPTGEHTSARVQENQQTSEQGKILTDEEVKQNTPETLKPEDKDVSQLKEQVQRLRDERGRFVKKQEQEIKSPEDIGLEKQQGANGKKGYYSLPGDTGLKVSLKVGDKEMHLNHIEATEPGKGAGGKMIEKLKTLSEATGKPITLDAQATEPALQDKLNAFYEKHGFVNDGTDTFRYEPKQELGMQDEEKLADRVDAIKPKTEAIEDAAGCITKKGLQS